jgi:hypothetical protein
MKLIRAAYPIKIDSDRFDAYLLWLTPTENEARKWRVFLHESARFLEGLVQSADFQELLACLPLEARSRPTVEMPHTPYGYYVRVLVQRTRVPHGGAGGKHPPKSLAGVLDSG